MAFPAVIIDIVDGNNAMVKIANCMNTEVQRLNNSVNLIIIIMTCAGIHIDSILECDDFTLNFTHPPKSAKILPFPKQIINFRQILHQQSSVLLQLICGCARVILGHLPILLVS